MSCGCLFSDCDFCEIYIPLSCVASEMTVPLAYAQLVLWQEIALSAKSQRQGEGREREGRSKNSSSLYRSALCWEQALKTWPFCLQICLSLHFLSEVGIEVSQRGCSQDFSELASCPGPGLGVLNSACIKCLWMAQFPKETLSLALPSLPSVLSYVPQLGSFPWGL